MKIFFTQDAEWLEKWDAFVSRDDKGSHLLLSDWVNSYKSYGFDTEFCIGLESGKIVGGYAAVIAKALVFKFYIVPFGPITSEGFEHHLNSLIASVGARGKVKNACYAHIALPVSPHGNRHSLKADPSFRVPKSKSGHLFKYVYSSSGLNWLDLQRFETENEILESFKTSVRRDIRSSLRKDIEVKYLESEAELKSGYAICLENAEKNNYSLRGWSEFKQTLLDLVAKNQAKFIAAYKDDDLKGAILLVKAGNYYTYILGGTKKEKPDLLAGHLLQWEAIKLSLAEKCDGYNLSLGGSHGVVAFKNGFGTIPIMFENSKHHWVLRPVFFKLYLFFEKRLGRHKKLISKLLSVGKR